MTQVKKINSIQESTLDGKATDIWPIPIDEDFLFTLLKDIFENYWQHIIFGPLIQGGAFEFRCPGAPQTITRLDGYLTVHFGGTHFHLCIGDNWGPQHNRTPIALREHRRTKKAEIFRGLDKKGHPLNWGLRLNNGKNEQLITIFFPNPFLTDADGVAKEPDWSRLAMWHYIAKQYLGHEPDGKDTMGTGFRKK